jgi:hypothetical protein
VVANPTGDGIGTLVGLAILAADFKSRIESGKISPSEPASMRAGAAVNLA